MPINYANYPANWEAIRQSILDRDDHRCKFCCVANYAYGWRDRAGIFHHWPAEKPESGWIAADRLLRIVLTIAHLDHDITNNTPDNLAALCQRCHLQHDQAHHTANAAATRRNKHLAAGQHELF